MMEAVEIRVPAVPVAQPRQRHTVIRGPGWEKVHNYTPARHPVQAFKATVRLAAQQAHPGPPLEGPLRLLVVFVLPRPSGMLWKKNPMPRAFHAGRPDLDNLAKALKDSVKGLLWRDDAQVAELLCRKVYAAGGEAPGVWLRVEALAGRAAGENLPLFPEECP